MFIEAANLSAWNKLVSIDDNIITRYPVLIKPNDKNTQVLYIVISKYKQSQKSQILIEYYYEF